MLTGMTEASPDTLKRLGRLLIFSVGLRQATKPAPGSPEETPARPPDSNSDNRGEEPR